MRLRRILPALALGATALLGCRADTDLTNPNTPTVATFWKTESDATTGLTAVYQSLNWLGSYQRWRAFNTDIRSDIGTSFSPWTDLANQSKFTYVDYDFPTLSDTWRDLYAGIGRANQVTTYVPNIAMNEATKTRYVGEAKFIRGLHYYQLVTLYGGNIPLYTTPPDVTDRGGPAGDAAVWTQIEKDFTEAAAALPVQLMAESQGHATKGAAQGMLGKALLQQRKWAAAATALQPVVQGQLGAYDLVSDYAALFTPSGNNTKESLFENQMGTEDTCGQGVCGLNFPRMIGPCGATWCDGRPTPFLFNTFRGETTTDGKPDPRLDATLFYYKGDTTMVHGETWAERRASEQASYPDNVLYFKKYSEYYDGSTTVNWDAPLNFKILRYADVLLMYAEALNEQGQTPQAYEYVNRVRARVRLAPLAAGLSQDGMRQAILTERIKEFALEGERWTDMLRQNLLSASNLPAVKANDPEFNNFVVGKSERLPIPNIERNVNQNLPQNPGW